MNEIDEEFDGFHEIDPMDDEYDDAEQQQLNTSMDLSQVQVGDRVRVKTWDWLIRNHTSYISYANTSQGEQIFRTPTGEVTIPMTRACGKEFTISGVDVSNGIKLVLSDPSNPVEDIVIQRTPFPIDMLVFIPNVTFVAPSNPEMEAIIAEADADRARATFGTPQPFNQMLDQI